MISTPENCFIQFNNDIPQGCAVQQRQCLPIVRSSDVSFQLVMDQVNVAPGPNDYVLKLFSDCDLEDIIQMPTGPYSSTDIFATILWSHVSEGNKAYGNITVNQDFNLDQVLDEGQCLYIGIVKVSGDNFQYENFYGKTGIDVAVSVVINGSTHSGTFDIASIYDIAAALQTFTTDNVQVQVVFGENLERIIIHALAGKVYGNITIGATVYSPVVNANADDLIACSNCFKYSADDCFTTVVQYRCLENAYGFNYETNENFKNVVRLPMLISKPQPVTNEKVFRYSDGTYKTLSAIHEKEFQGKTEWMSEAWNFRLSIALKHDTLALKLAGESRFTSYVNEGNYEIEWMDDPGLLIDLGTGKFKVKQYPYYQVNSNSQ